MKHLYIIYSVVYACVLNLFMCVCYIVYVQGPGDTNEYYQERRLRELDLLRPLVSISLLLPCSQST